MILIAALDRAGGIGRGGTIPWRLRADLAFFKALTTSPDPAAVLREGGLPVDALPAGLLQAPPAAPEMATTPPNAVIMGRKTWDSLPTQWKPLPGRLNLVLSRADVPTPESGGKIVASLEAALTEAERNGAPHIFVIGGAQVYAEALVHPRCRLLVLTRVDRDFGCDVRFPAIPDGFTPLGGSPRLKEEGTPFRMELLIRL